VKVLVAVVVLTALALVGSRRGLVSGRPPDAVHMLFTGSEFIVIGLLLGSDFLNVIDETTLDRLRPFVCVALGWVGFLFGLQFDRRTLQRLPHGFLAISVSVAVITMFTVAPAMWFLLGGTALLATVTLTASAACTGQTGIALAIGRKRPRSRDVMTLLRFVSSLDSMVGVIVFGVAMSLFASHPFGAGGTLAGLQWLVISVAIGFLTAWIFVSMTLTRTSQSELVLYLLGVIALASGVAFGLRLSVLFVNAVCGVVVANLAHVRSIRCRVMDLMAHSERFLYLLLLVLAGAYWKLPDRWTLLAAGTYVMARGVGKVIGGYISTRSLTRQHPVPRLVGLGLVSQGGMALAIIIDFQPAAPSALSQMIVGVAITAIIANELLAPWLTALVAENTVRKSK